MRIYWEYDIMKEKKMYNTHNKIYILAMMMMMKKKRNIHGIEHNKFYFLLLMKKKNKKIKCFPWCHYEQFVFLENEVVSRTVY